MKRIVLTLIFLGCMTFPIHAQTSGSTPPPPPYCTSANAGALYTNTGTSPATVYTCSYYNLAWQWVVNPSYGGLVYYPTVPATCSGALPVFLAGWPNTQEYVCVNGVPNALGGGGTGLPPGWTATGSGPAQVVTAPGNLDVTGTVAAGATFIAGDGYQSVNVKAEGAKGDGSTNDSAAFSAAFLAANGTCVYVPPGTYMLDNISVVADVCLILDANASLKHIANTGHPVFALGWTQDAVQSFTLTGGTLDGNQAAMTTTAYEDFIKGNLWSNQKLSIRDANLINSALDVVWVDNFGGVLDLTHNHITGQAFASGAAAAASGLTINVVASSGVVTSGTVGSPAGTSYDAGDIVPISQGSCTAIFQVASTVSGYSPGVPATVSLLSGGTGCATASNVPVVALRPAATQIVQVNSGEVGATHCEFDYNNNRAIASALPVPFGTAGYPVDGTSPGGIMMVNRPYAHDAVPYIGNFCSLHASDNYFYGYGAYHAGQDIAPIHVYPGWGAVHLSNNTFDTSATGSIVVKSSNDVVIDGTIVRNGQKLGAMTTTYGGITLAPGWLTGGSAAGTGLTANITAVNGIITAATPVGGTGFVTGDTVSVSRDGATGQPYCLYTTLQVTASSGVPSALAVLQGGQGCVTQTGVAVIGQHNSRMTVTNTIIDNPGIQIPGGSASSVAGVGGPVPGISVVGTSVSFAQDILLGNSNISNAGNCVYVDFVNNFESDNLDCEGGTGGANGSQNGYYMPGVSGAIKINGGIVNSRNGNGLLITIGAVSSNNATLDVTGVQFNHTSTYNVGVGVYGVASANFAGNTFNAPGLGAVTVTTDNTYPTARLNWSASNTVIAGALNFVWGNITCAAGDLVSNTAAIDTSPVDAGVVPCGPGFIYRQVAGTSPVPAPMWVSTGTTAASWVPLVTLPQQTAAIAAAVISAGAYVTPVISSTAGDLACALHADTTIGAETITAGSTTGTTATLTAASVPNVYYVGQLVGVAGATPSGLNGGPYALTAVTNGTSGTVSFANSSTVWTSGGTFFLWCGNQSTDAVLATPYYFASTAPIGVFTSTASYLLNAQFSGFSAATVANPSFRLRYATLANLYIEGGPPVMSASLTGTGYEFSWDVNALSSTLLQTTVNGVPTLPTNSGLSYFLNSIIQPVKITSVSGDTFNIGVFFSAATAGNAVQLSTFKEWQQK